MKAVPYSAADAAAWDDFVQRSGSATFLHTRRYLSYHGDRFEDASLLFVDGSDRLVGVLPAARDPAVGGKVVSHPGLTYGGVIVAAGESDRLTPEIIGAACAHYAQAGYDTLRYKPVPAGLQRRPSQRDEHVLWTRGATLVRCDLWSMVQVRSQPELDETRRRRVRRAREQAIVVRKESSDAAYGEFHDMLSERLRERHSAQPTHRLVEMLALRDLLGDRVTLWTARDRHGDCVAGEWIYDFGHARHGQYGCASEAGRKCFAQDLILFEVIAACAADGVPVFSFGSSTENEGRHVNAGLLSYKASFGAHSVIHPHYELRLA